MNKSTFDLAPSFFLFQLWYQKIPCFLPTALGLSRQNANYSCVLGPPSAIDNGQPMDDCGDNTFCCQTQYNQNCCSLGDFVTLGPFSNTSTITVTSFIVITNTATPTGSIPANYVTSSNTQLLSPRSTTKNPASSSTELSDDRTHSATSPTNSNASDLDSLTLPKKTSVASPESTAKSGVTGSRSSSSPAIKSSSPLPSVSASPSGSSPKKTTLGLGIGLCLGVGLAFIGFVIWFFRRKQRNQSRRKKLHISRPINIRAISIPIFEVANTDWELPVDPHMPTELRANRSTNQSWI